MSEAVRLWVDRGLCVGSGTCVALAPGAFRLGDDGKSRPVREVVEAPGTAPDGTADTDGLPDMDGIADAVDSCPVQAIRTEPA